MQSPKRRGNRRSKNGSLARIPARLNVLMGIVVLMLGLLGWRLVTLQVTDSETYKSAVNSAESSTEKVNVQRGMIYDSTGQVLVANKGSQAITYTKPKGVTEAEMYDIANEVAKYISIDTDQLSSGNYATYYIQDTKRATKVVKASGTKTVPGTDDYVAALKSYVQKHEAKFPLSDKQKNAAMIFQKMANAYSLSTVYIKETGVTQEEIANIGERQSKMPGVRVGIYYTRDYPQGDSIKALVGSTSTSKSGLPEDSVNKLLTEGYSRDDIVGTSYLEKQYEDALKGTKGQVEVTTDKDGKTTEKTTYAGQAGDSLTLTINSKTGGVYATAGVNRDNETGKTTPDALSTVNQANVVGSVVKPAMITTGFLNGTITAENNTITDQPITVAGTATKSSWFNRNGSGSMPLTADTALMVSSNSYVMQLMLKMGGLNYFPGMSLGALPTSVFQTMRDGIARFGLGVKTGIDLPGEITGVKGSTTREDIGKALDESFGQYDTFTTM